MQKYAVWVTSAVIAVLMFPLGRALGLGDIPVLILAAVGAILSLIHI